MWECFWCGIVAGMPVIDQVSTVLRGETTEQIISVSLMARATIGIGLVVFAYEHRGWHGHSVQHLGRLCTAFGSAVAVASMLRWNSEAIPYLFRILWWLWFLYCTYAAVQSAVIRRSVLANALLAGAVVQLLSLLFTPLVGDYGRGVTAPEYVEVGAVSGLFYSTKGVAQSLALAIPVVLLRFRAGLVRSTAVFAVLLGVAVTFSRTAIAAAVVSLSAAALSDLLTRGSRRLVRLGLSAALFVLPIYGIVLSIGWERLTYRWMGERSGRSEFWRLAAVSWWEGDVTTLFFGKGLGASLDVLGALYGRIWCHCDLLEILLCQGLVGLLLYLRLVSYLIRVLFRDPVSTPHKGLGFALACGFVTCSLLSGMLYQLDVIGTFIVALAVLSPEARSGLPSGVPAQWMIRVRPACGRVKHLLPIGRDG